MINILYVTVATYFLCTVHLVKKTKLILATPYSGKLILTYMPQGPNIAVIETWLDDLNMEMKGFMARSFVGC